MLSSTAIKRLATLPEISKAGKRVNGLFRLMESQILWEMAYSKVAQNKGALTPGVDGQTFDGFSLEKVQAIMTRLMEGAYDPQPVRRVYIPKATGKQRPLVVRCRQKSPSNRAPSPWLLRVCEASRGYQPSASHH